MTQAERVAKVLHEMVVRAENPSVAAWEDQPVGYRIGAAEAPVVQMIMLAVSRADD